MSAGQTIGQTQYGEAPVFGVIRSITEGRPFRVVQANHVCGYGVSVDTFRTRCAAEYAARLLNRGVARVDSHAIVGCKVVAS